MFSPRLVPVVLVFVAAGAAQAQTAVRSERNVSLALANQIAGEAVAACQALGYAVAATVVDRAGGVRAVQRADNAGPHTLGSSERKAWTSASAKNATQAMMEAAQKNPGAANLVHLPGFLLLWTLSRWRVARRTTLRYELENQRIERWFGKILSLAHGHPALALEVARLQRLVKGYGDTHARGLGNYETLMTILERHENRLAPAALGELREAALASEDGQKLRFALQRMALA